MIVNTQTEKLFGYSRSELLGQAGRSLGARAFPRSPSGPPAILFRRSAHALDGLGPRARRPTRGRHRVPGRDQLEPARHGRRRAGLRRHSRHHRAQEGGRQVPRSARVRAGRDGDRGQGGAHHARQRPDREALRLHARRAARPTGRGAGAASLSRQASRTPPELLLRPQSALDGLRPGAQRHARGRHGVSRRNQLEPARDRRRRAGLGGDSRHHRSQALRRDSTQEPRARRAEPPAASWKSRTSAFRRPTA